MIKNPYKPLEKALGYRFRKKERLTTALTHPSYRNEQTLDTDNQRMEYLGDAVVDLICADYLYERFPDQAEGVLTRLRSLLTNTTTLAHIAENIGLGQALLLGKGEENSGGRQRPSNLADAMEATLGAAYLDGGIKAARKIFYQAFQQELDTIDADSTDNPKGRLQEKIQHEWKCNPTYHTTAQSGPLHDPHFTIEVRVNDTLLATGTGNSKRAAECAAARQALTADTP